VQETNEAKLLGSSSWKEQFKDAFSVGGGDEEGKRPGCGAYLLHFLTLFWKVLFAFIPPSG
jgi:solute carrier family 8 (sodium/calcium exchanger)